TPIRQVLDPRLWLSIATVAGLCAAAWKARRTQLPIALGVAWFLALLIPASVLILLGQGEPMTEHRIYLASGGLFIAAGAVVGVAAERLPRWRVAGAGLLALTVAALGSQTVTRNRIWADPIVLWRESVALAPDHPR